MTSMRTILAAATAVSAFSGIAHADPVDLNQWYSFAFDGTIGGPLSAGTVFGLGVDPTSVDAPDPAWTFTLSNLGGTLIFTDGFQSGDQFDIKDGATDLGLTSTPTAGYQCNNDITACLADPSFSKGSYLLSGGDHSISGTLVATVGTGAGFFEVVPTAEPAVPEPASWAMMLAGFGLVGAGMRRRSGRMVQAV